MPELLPKGPPAQLRLMAPLFVCALSVCALPTRSLAQTPPASLRACAAEPDPGRRLACYDREMGRSSPRPPPQGSAAAPPPEPARASRPAPAQAAHAPSSPAAAVPAPSGESPAPQRQSRWKLFTGGGSSRVTARVTRLDRSPDAMVLHLDNGQVWRQVGRASGDLSLKTGDSVTIEKHLGSYWLSARYVSNMRVRQEPR